MKQKLRWVAPESVERSDVIFAVGDEHKEALLHFYPGHADRYRVVGNPRWDLLRPELRGSHDREVAAIRAQHAPLWDRWIRHEADFALPGGGESNTQYYARVMRALQATLGAHAGARIAVFTHGGVLDMLWRAAGGHPLHGPRTCEIPNTGINRLRWSGDALEVLCWGQATHLDGLPEQPSTVPASV